MSCIIWKFGWTNFFGSYTVRNFFTWKPLGLFLQNKLPSYLIWTTYHSRSTMCTENYIIVQWIITCDFSYSKSFQGIILADKLQSRVPQSHISLSTPTPHVTTVQHEIISGMAPFNIKIRWKQYFSTKHLQEIVIISLVLQMISDNKMGSLTRFWWRGGSCLYSTDAMMRSVTASALHSLSLTCECWQTSSKWAVTGRHQHSILGKLTSPDSRSLATGNREGSCIEISIAPFFLMKTHIATVWTQLLKIRHHKTTEGSIEHTYCSIT